MTTIAAYHGTSTNYEGTPAPRTCINGLTGIFFTESESDAWDFAEMLTQGADDGAYRVFAATIDLEGAEDLTGEEWDDAGHWEIVEAAAASDAPVIILPNMSGVSEREILVRWTNRITWA